MEDRTGRPVVFAQHTDRFIVENDNMDSYTEAESEMSLNSRSFLHMVKIDGEPMEFEWNIFPGFTTLQLCNEVQEFL